MYNWCHCPHTDQWLAIHDPRHTHTPSLSLSLLHTHTHTGHQSPTLVRAHSLSTRFTRQSAAVLHAPFVRTDHWPPYVMPSETHPRCRRVNTEEPFAVEDRGKSEACRTMDAESLFYHIRGSGENWQKIRTELFVTSETRLDFKKEKKKKKEKKERKHGALRAQWHIPGVRRSADWRAAERSRQRQLGDVKQQLQQHVHSPHTSAREAERWAGTETTPHVSPGAGLEAEAETPCVLRQVLFAF